MNKEKIWYPDLEVKLDAEKYMKVSKDLLFNNTKFGGDIDPLVDNYKLRNIVTDFKFENNIFSFKIPKQLDYLESIEIHDVDIEVVSVIVNDQTSMPFSLNKSIVKFAFIFPVYRTRLADTEVKIVCKKDSNIPRIILNGFICTLKNIDCTGNINIPAIYRFSGGCVGFPQTQ